MIDRVEEISRLLSAHRTTDFTPGNRCERSDSNHSSRTRGGTGRGAPGVRRSGCRVGGGDAFPSWLRRWLHGWVGARLVCIAPGSLSDWLWPTCLWLRFDWHRVGKALAMTRMPWEGRGKTKTCIRS